MIISNSNVNFNNLRKERKKNKKGRRRQKDIVEFVINGARRRRRRRKGPFLSELATGNSALKLLSSMAFSMQLYRLPTRTDAAMPENFTAVRSLRYRKPMSVRCDGDSSSSSSSSSSSAAVDSNFDAKVFRRNLTKSDNYNRKGFGYKDETLALMNREYTSKPRSS